MKPNIFTEIMNLIERNTDMPRIESGIEEWLKKDEDNKNIYEIYKLASIARKL